jgi:hypothetical protein
MEFKLNMHLKYYLYLILIYRLRKKNNFKKVNNFLLLFSSFYISNIKIISARNKIKIN